MQVLDITNDVEFFTQTVSEQRVHYITKEAIALNNKRGKPKLEDAETRRFNICVAEQRVTKRNQASKPFVAAGTSGFRLHLAVLHLLAVRQPHAGGRRRDQGALAGLIPLPWYLFRYVVARLPKSTFLNEVSVGAIVAFNGVLGTLQLLYNIWDLNHGFLGCCHVACKRIEFLVSLRRSAKLLAVILNRAGVQYIYLHIALVAP
jgi:hypothetical protein